MVKSPLSIEDFPAGFERRLDANLQDCRARIAAAAVRSGRADEGVTLITVSKYVDSGVMRVLYDLGVRKFGENRPQEAARKSRELADLDGVEIHFIGHLQRNKARLTVEHCRSVHSLNSPRLLKELERRLEDLETGHPDIFVEVNISGEESKMGLPAEELTSLLTDISSSPNVAARLHGLMTIPPYSSEPDAARACFTQLRRLRDQHLTSGLLPPGAGLSMGMSSDFEMAIEEGATVVRVGSAIYSQD